MGISLYIWRVASTFTNKYSRCCSKLYESAGHSQAFNYGRKQLNPPVAKYTSTHARLHIACAICVFFLLYICYMCSAFSVSLNCSCSSRLPYTHYPVVFGFGVCFARPDGETIRQTFMNKENTRREINHLFRPGGGSGAPERIVV